MASHLLYLHSYDRDDDCQLIMFRNEREIRDHLLEAIGEVERNQDKANYGEGRFRSMSTDRLFNYVLHETPDYYENWPWTPVRSIVIGIGMKEFGDNK